MWKQYKLVSSLDYITIVQYSLTTSNSSCGQITNKQKPDHLIKAEKAAQKLHFKTLRVTFP